MLDHITDFLRQTVLELDRIRGFPEDLHQLKQRIYRMSQELDDLNEFKADYEIFKQTTFDAITSLLAKIQTLSTVTTDPAVDNGIKSMTAEILADTLAFRDKLTPAPVVVPTPVPDPIPAPATILSTDPPPTPDPAPVEQPSV